ncbi:hypothetical protein HRI_004690300 [Hibiscus trionum]|uniref:Retrotransposon gag domain-containing protein n=1 Tax=Hibiscus trionum TaxID=183268 RepID=A0A9W7MUV8_HIBTR|nr:hypothetical protein HRI_004690300 [Hibiscus trionum]
MVDGVPITRSQSWQQETSKLQEEIGRVESSIDAKMDAKFGEFRTQIGEDMRKMLELALGKRIEPVGNATGSQSQVFLGGPGVLGSNPRAGAAGEDGQSPGDTEPEVEIVNEQNSRGNNSVGVENQGSFGNLTFKLPCPRFDGDDFRGWHSKLEQYFEAEAVPENSKIRLVMLHLEGKALQWHQFLMRNQEDFANLGWSQYLRLIRERFCPGGFDDPFEDLLELRQQESVEKFYEEFVSLVNQVQLPDKYILSIFKNHLRLEISQFLNVLQPKTLMEAFHTAKHLENMFFPTGGKSSFRSVAPSTLTVPNRSMASGYRSVMNSSTSISPSVPQRSPTHMPSGSSVLRGGTNSHKPGGSKTLSAAERDERRKKGLCFWCAAKYAPGHKCSKSQIFQIVVEGKEEEGEPEIFLDCEENEEVLLRGEDPVISLQAMWGANCQETMKLRVKVKGIEWVALVDSGSTHNFLSLAVVKQLGLGIDRRCNLKVTVADGNVLGTLGWCNQLQCETQGEGFSSDFLVVGLKNCDAVLGVQWLSTLGAISWDFNTLRMQFVKED